MESAGALGATAPLQQPVAADQAGRTRKGSPTQWRRPPTGRIDTYRPATPSDTTEDAFPSTTRGTFAKRNHTLGQDTHFHKQMKKNSTLQCSKTP